MHVCKRIIFSLVLIFTLSACSCCDILHYSAVCEGNQITVTVSFQNSFDGTVFANGYNGDPSCSLPNMETSGSTLVELSLPFMKCNTTIRRVEGKDYLQAMNIITIQFHPLIKGALDCEIIATCDIDYQLPYDFFRSYLNRDLELPTSVESKLDIMSGEKLFGDVISGILEVSKKQFLVLNVSDGGKHDQLRIRKCYAHATYVIDENTHPDLLLDDNQCNGAGIINLLSLNADESYSDLRDFSEIKNFDISFSQKLFYITCAFDMCSESCSYSCFGDIEVKNSRWSTVRTYEVGKFDESFKGFRNRNMDLRTSVKILSDRLLKLKDFQIARKNPLNSRRRTSRLDSSGDMANGNVSMVFPEETFTVHDESDKLIELEEEIFTTIYISEVSEGMPAVNINQDAARHSFENFIDDVNLNSSENKVSEGFGKRSIVEEETEYFDNEETTIVDSQKTTIVTDISDKSKISISGTDCLNSSCRPNEDARSIIALKTSVIKTISLKDRSLEFNETMDSTSDYNLTVASEGILTADNLIEKDCVPYLKFTSVTASLSVLCVCLFVICIAVILYTRKERKRFNSHSKYLYNDF